MDEIFVNKLAERAKIEADLIAKLPDDVRELVEQKVSNTEFEEV